jgi:dynein heavy chain 1
MLLFRRNVIQYNQAHSDFPLPGEQLDRYIPKVLVYSLLWSFGGDAKLKVRSDLGDFIRSVTTIPLPPHNPNTPIIDYEVSIPIHYISFY